MFSFQNEAGRILSNDDKQLVDCDPQVYNCNVAMRRCYIITSSLFFRCLLHHSCNFR